MGVAWFHCLTTCISFEVSLTFGMADSNIVPRATSHVVLDLDGTLLNTGVSSLHLNITIFYLIPTMHKQMHLGFHYCRTYKNERWMCVYNFVASLVSSVVNTL